MTVAPTISFVYGSEDWWVEKRAPAPLVELEAAALAALSDLAWSPGKPWGLPGILRSEPGLLLRRYLAGQTLAQLLQQQSWPQRFLRFWLDRLGQLLQAIHERGYWHGDVCPANILILEDNSIVLLDWGSAEWGTPPYAELKIVGPERDKRALERLRHELLSGLRRVDSPPERLVGRQQLVADLRSAWKRSLNEEGLWLALSGPSGCGKTSLLREILWWAPRIGWGQASTLTTPRSYNLFQSLLETLDLTGLDLPPESDENAMWAQLATTFPQFAARLQRRWPTVTSPLAPILIAEAWLQLLTRLCRKGPLVLIFDDVQWMDPSSQELLEVLSGRPIAGLMVALAWRSESFQPPPNLRLDHHEAVPPLTRDQVLRWCVSEGLDLSQAENLAHWTQGNAMLVADWLKSPHRPELSARATFLLQERIQSLPTPLRRLLQVAALLGKQFEALPLQILGQKPEEIEHWLRLAMQEQLVLPDLGFSHDRVRETLLAQIDPEQKREWHRQLGAFFEECQAAPQVCAFHYAESGQAQKARPFALAAARKERDRAALPSAAYFYEIVCGESPLPLAASLEYGDLLKRLGRYQEAETLLNQASRECNVRSVQAQILVMLAELAHHQNERKRAIELIRPALKQVADRQIAGRAWSILLESTYSSSEYASLVAIALTNLPNLLKSLLSDPVLLADIAAVLQFSGALRAARALQKRLLSASFRHQRLVASRIQSRIFLYRYADANPQFQLRVLTQVCSVQEQLGPPWDLCMNYMQLCLYASVMGDFPKLLNLSRRLEELATLARDPSWLSIACCARAIATGGRLSSAELAHLKSLKLSGIWDCHRAVAIAQAAHARRQNAEAWQVLRQANSFNPIDLGFLWSWRASAARRLAEHTPRRSPDARRQYFEEALHWGHKTLRNRLARMFFFQAQREIGLALVGLGRSQEAPQWFAASVVGAARFGATLQEALSWQAWGRVGMGLGWPRSQERLDHAADMLGQLGAWWHLCEQPDSLPLPEVGQAAWGFLEHPSPASRQSLAEWVGADWVAHLEGVLLRESQLQAELVEARRQTELQANRWQAFLDHGPVRVTLHSGPPDPSTEGVRVALGPQEFALVSLPWRRTGLSHCLAFLDSQKRELLRMLDKHREKIKRLSCPPSRTVLLGELESVASWQSNENPAAIFERLIQAAQTTLTIHVLGQPPWRQLRREGCAALLGVLREALQNRRKHSPGEVQIVIIADEKHLKMTVSGGGQPAQAASRGGFGLRAMHFRASLAGGHLGIDEHYTIELTLPVDPR